MILLSNPNVAIRQKVFTMIYKISYNNLIYFLYAAASDLICAKNF